MVVWIILGVFLLVGLPLLFYFPQRHYVFSPTYYPNRSWFREHTDRYRLHRLQVAPAVEIEGITYEPDQPALTILYFGGKEQDSVGLVQKLSSEYPQVRWVAFNYRGYGESRGRPTEKNILADSLIAYGWTVRHYENVGLLGYSLGSSVASYVASRREPKWVILVAPFDSVRALVREKAFFVPELFIRYKFDTADFVEKITAPVFVYNSSDDEIVAPRHVARLRRHIHCLAAMKEFSGYGHDTLLFSASLKKELEKIVQGTPQCNINSEDLS